MKFNVCIIDPPGYRFTHFLYDLSKLLAYGLEDVGGDCTLTRNRLESGRTNVVMGAHNITHADQVDAIVDAGLPYVFVSTEVVVGKTVNRVEAPEYFENVFMPLLRNAAAVWDAGDSLPALKQLGIDAHDLRFGFHPRLHEIRHKAERDLDFCFFGSLTERRKAIVEQLRDLGYRIRWMFDDDAIFRNDMLARSELVLTLRQSDTMVQLPQGRLLYLVNNRCVVVGESGTGQAPVEDLFLWTANDDVIELCRETRARNDLRELADVFHQRLEKRPMRAYLEPLVASLRTGDSRPAQP